LKEIDYLVLFVTVLKTSLGVFLYHVQVFFTIEESGVDDKKN
jgi:hypothetical protein